MKKAVLVIVIAFLVAGGVWIAWRIQRARAQASVAELLPKTTLALVHVPDFRRTREQWHASDVYQIWREPAVQAWLQKPLAQIRKDQPGRQTLESFLKLGPTHGFVALTALENNDPKVIAGFHFEQSEETARQFLEPRLNKWFATSIKAKRETTSYREHRIETARLSHALIAMAYNKNWFFAANDLGLLKTVLDRTDGQTKDSGESLRDNEAHEAALRHMPADHAATVFLELQPFIGKLLPLLNMTGQTFSNEQVERLKQVRCIAGSFGFDRGKMREAIFVAMPRMQPPLKLMRPSLAIADRNTFFYSTSLMRWNDKWVAPAQARLGLPLFLQQLVEALASRGVSAADLKTAFAEELEIIGEWPPDAHWPTLLATLPVKDGARARKIVEALTSVELAGATWTRSEKAGVSYYQVEPFGGFVPLAPAIAVSDKVLVAGSDAGTVEAAMTKSADPANALDRSATFREAAARLPAADSAFAYVDTRLFYERVDAVLRPLVLMGATFYPALAKNIDPKKFPPAETIAKHLSPIVMSQRYVPDGYMIESSGPVTFNEATIGLVGAFGGAFAYLQETLKHGTLPLGKPSPPAAASPAPSPSPSASPF